MKKKSCDIIFELWGTFAKGFLGVWLDRQIESTFFPVVLATSALTLARETIVKSYRHSSWNNCLLRQMRHRILRDLYHSYSKKLLEPIDFKVCAAVSTVLIVKSRTVQVFRTMITWVYRYF